MIKRMLHKGKHSFKFLNTQHTSGFTLIELLVVVLIIAILASIAVPQYTRTVNRARLAELITVTASLSQSSERYFSAAKQYTDDIADLDIDIGQSNFKGSMLTMPTMNWKIAGNNYYTLYTYQSTSFFSLGLRTSAGKVPEVGIIRYSKNYSSVDLNGKTFCMSFTVNSQATCLAAGGKLAPSLSFGNGAQMYELTQ